MSQLLLNWLNNDLQLSMIISDFSDSFRDGYLFGEILNRYNQQDDFSQFSMKGTPTAILNNFSLLEVSLKKIPVHFNSQIARAIMDGNEKIIKTLLYELKTALNSVARNCITNPNSATNNHKKDKVLNVIPSSKQAFDKASTQTYQHVVRSTLENRHEAMMKEIDSKYYDKTLQYTRTVQQLESFDQDTILMNRQRNKDIYQSRKDHEQDFKQAWNELNLEVWKKNQTIAKNRKKLYKNINEFITTQHVGKVSKVKDEIKEYTMKSMDEFDKRLENMILPTTSNNNQSSSLIKSIRA